MYVTPAVEECRFREFHLSLVSAPVAAVSRCWFVWAETQEILHDSGVAWDYRRRIHKVLHTTMDANHIRCWDKVQVFPMSLWKGWCGCRDIWGIVVGEPEAVSAKAIEARQYAHLAL